MLLNCECQCSKAMIDKSLSKAMPNGLMLCYCSNRQVVKTHTTLGPVSDAAELDTPEGQMHSKDVPKLLNPQALVRVH